MVELLNGWMDCHPPVYQFTHPAVQQFPYSLINFTSKFSYF